MDTLDFFYTHLKKSLIFWKRTKGRTEIVFVCLANLETLYFLKRNGIPKNRDKITKSFIRFENYTRQWL